jgi:GNAT superfamily N-acetyltransferase
MVDYAPPPEVLHGWLTLHWSARDISNFLSSSSTSLQDSSFSVIHGDIRIKFEEALATIDNNGSKFRLRLATEQDLDAISRLVHGLAVYEDKPDAVHVTKDHYRSDGFATEPPLFYCVLLDSDADNDSSYTCGMAFCYVARKRKDGMFLYLEDLFIEEDYRGAGAGMVVMRALANVALSTGCDKMVWQALDWNKPALNFYSKLGARVVEGLVTARFTGETLKEFASVDK